jgi:hypothetical protein
VVDASPELIKSSDLLIVGGPTHLKDPAAAHGATVNLTEIASNAEMRSSPVLSDGMLRSWGQQRARSSHRA